MQPTTDPKIDHFMQPKITGYRQLGADEVKLMNEAKTLGAQFEDLINRLRDYHVAQVSQARACLAAGPDSGGDDECLRLVKAEPARWLAMGRTGIQTGVMKIVRSIAQPTV